MIRKRGTDRLAAAKLTRSVKKKVTIFAKERVPLSKVPKKFLKKLTRATYILIHFDDADKKCSCDNY